MLAAGTLFTSGAFTGQIEKVVLHLGETKLSAADQEALMAAETRRRAGE